MGTSIAYGLPILNTETLDQWLLKEVLVWPDARPPVFLEDWLAEEGRPEGDRRAAARFAPKVKVVEQKKPNGGTFAHFIVDEGRGILIFCLLPHLKNKEDSLVVLVAEPKPWGVSIMPPGARWDEKETIEECCLRDFTEETGILMDGVVSLAGGRAMPYHRRLGGRGDGTFWFRGVVEKPVKLQEPQKDPSEPVRAFLMPLSEWIGLCENGGSEYGVVEACGPAITLLALSGQIA